MKEESFKVGIAYLQKYLGRELNPEVYKIYWNLLKDLSESNFNLSLKNIIMEFQPSAQTPFPLVKHFLELCGQSGDTKIQNLITAIKKASITVGQYKSVDFNDGALHSVINRYGGWPIVSMWTEQDWQYNERNFIAAYKSTDITGIKEPYLRGIHEESNRANGFKKSIPPPINIGLKPKEIIKPKEKEIAK